MVKKLRTAASVGLGMALAADKVSDEAKKEGLEKSLAKEGKRIVALTDVTVTKEKLTKAVVKSGKMPGNEVPAFVELILKEIIMA